MLQTSWNGPHSAGRRPAQDAAWTSDLILHGMGCGQAMQGRADEQMYTMVNLTGLKPMI